MPRNYKPDPRGKKYIKYDFNLIQQAVNEYSESNGSLDTISKKYNIHRSVLYRHCTKNMKSQGGQTVLSKETEEEFIKYINICADWGYPLEAYDLRVLVKVYLDKLGVNEKRFNNNMPGPDFVSSFMKRHKDAISQRLSQNIKRNRAAVSPEIIKKYFEELEISLSGVPMCNIINYDETNLSDDPGRKKIITKKGVKYPERVMNHSKSAVSIMIACTAEGELLPPYVVYKAQHLYDTWTVKGPKGTRYNRSQSGWFDGTIFEDWIKSVIIPYFQGVPGRKILIGDNLSSHLSLDLIKLCHEENIRFVFLPANSTHITQPLDVAFFRPMKIAWRNILYQWKKADGRQQASVPKGCFPRLLSMLLDALKHNSKENILSGFKKAGINPLDPTQVLKRLPGYDRVSHQPETINESVLTILKEMRYGTINVAEPKRKRKIEVEPGKSVSLDESYAETEIENQEPKKKNKKTNKESKDNNKQNEPITKKGKGIGKKTKIQPHTNVTDETKSLAANCLQDDLEVGTSQMFYDHESQLHSEPSTSFYKEETALLPQSLTTCEANDYLDIEKIPIIFGDDVVIDHFETIDNLNVSSDAMISSNEIKSKQSKKSNKIEILSDISVTDPKQFAKILYDNKMKRKQHKHRNYYRNDEEILSDLMSDTD